MIRLLQFLVIEIKKKSENEIMETLTLRLLMRWSTTAYEKEARLRSEEILGLSDSSRRRRSGGGRSVSPHGL